ncbi:cysteine-rich with EGF-like domain protein 2 isoform X2 [Belonocnema kinseyi]|uniref:cysteine-rich with EGF-like domain protein 2 isoform X2 n=1 Tax=Belonocnema kinseyi TaxID=2817044 RepID=UPI00143D277D|nr:cysteine-rich with EGF-like domain protein 2 isoform X2 [Belonocnema kinseyi]
MLKTLIPVFYRTFALLSVISICQVIGSKNSKAKLNKDDLHSIQLPPCAACKVLIESFKKGMETTSRGKFEGGDSAWEEDKLGSYARSEVRLIEIQEQICKDVERGKRQCQSLAEELESVFETWWFKKQASHPDLYTYVCIEEVKNCCPKDHFGQDCEKCPGFPDKVCNNNGKCKGSGTRKGSGLCSCDKGYTGIECSECDTGYYQSYKDDNKLLCSICHSACGNSCTGPGPRNCINCSKGWQLVDGKGCFDIDECLLSNKRCKNNQFCVNEEGSYKCLECDKSCNGCNGDGPDMCMKCADGHHLKDNFCITHQHQLAFLPYPECGIGNCRLTAFALLRLQSSR